MFHFIGVTCVVFICAVLELVARRYDRIDARFLAFTLLCWSAVYASAIV